MTKRPIFASLLLLSSALVAPAAIAQDAGSEPAADAQPVATEAPAAEDAAADAAAQAADDAAAQDEQGDVSIPGGADQEIVVTGRFTPNVVRATPEVVSVLSSADIARTGEGDISGSLQRVTGLSVVGGGFVYVRGLGDRYSLALLNGSPLPSPEPLKRVVPLDIFPSNVIDSTLVQKSYSVNFPGEFGGGVINLTTKAIPREPFLTLSGRHRMGQRDDERAWLHLLWQRHRLDGLRRRHTRRSAASESRLRQRQADPRRRRFYAGRSGGDPDGAGQRRNDAAATE
jgi:outer membrane receptor for Fe3+-dicitrate